jgi:hypothetical protein
MEATGLHVPGVSPDWHPPEGCKVIAAGTPLDGIRTAVAIVLCERHRPMDTAMIGEPYEYVTGDVYAHTLEGWGNGHYFFDEDDATYDYRVRMERGY